MNNEKEIRLPTDFDGVFRFTNYSEEEYRDRWDNVEYTFPPLKTVPLIIPTASPLEVQNIRKKFAKGLGTREFYKSSKASELDAMNKNAAGLHSAVTYAETDIAPFVQRCLEPLALAQVALKQLPRDDERRYKKDEKGRPRTKVLDENESLVGDGTVMSE